MIRYVTRWALSTGIREVDGEYVSDAHYFRGTVSGGMTVLVSGSEAFPTLDGAVARAKVMAQLRAQRLYEQANKLADPMWQPKVVRR